MVLYPYCPMLSIGVRVPEALFSSPAAQRDDALRMLSEGGISHLSTGDHISFNGGQGYDGLVRAASLLSMSAVPEVHVGVYLLALRHPVLVARQIATIGEMWPGRLQFGIGVGGDDPHEYEVCGVDRSTRGARTDEALALLRGFSAAQQGSQKLHQDSLQHLRRVIGQA